MKTVEARSPSGSSITYMVSATDETDSNPTVSCTPPSGSTFPIGSTSVACTATDAAGNSVSASFTVIVQDTRAPQLNLPASMIVEAKGPDGTPVSFSVSTTDTYGVDPSPTISCDHRSGETFSLGTTVVSCTATDFSGNTSRSSFTVTVKDTTPPDLDVPSNITVKATDSDGAVVTFSASANDRVDPSPEVDCNPPSGNTFPVGITTVLCTATDASGNTGHRTFIVKVEEAAPPSQIKPITLNIEGEGTGAGNITGPGIACHVRPSGRVSGLCTTSTIDPPKTITLNATASSGSTFEGWSGCDSSSRSGACQITLDENDITVISSFAREGNLPTLFVNGSGSGSGRVSGSGINCTISTSGSMQGMCMLPVSNSPQTLNLTAAASSDSVFDGWSDCDATAGASNEDCIVTVNFVDRNVTAAFSEYKPPAPPEEDQPQPPEEPQPPADQDTQPQLPAEGCKGRKLASITLGGENIEDCLYLVEGGEHDTGMVIVGDPPVEARRTGGGEAMPSDENDWQDFEMWFLIDDDFMAQGIPTSQVRIEVEYFDEGTDQFQLYYDQYSPYDEFREGPKPEAPQSFPLIVRKTDSQTWKTAVFAVENAYFGYEGRYDHQGRPMGKGDLRISYPVGISRELNRPQIIRRVTVSLFEDNIANLPPEDRSCHFKTSASIILGEQIVEDCLYLISGNSSDTEVVYVGDPPVAAHRTGGRDLLGIPGANFLRDTNMNFQVADTVIFEGESAGLVHMEIEYFDQGHDTFTVYYDGRDLRNPRRGESTEGENRMALKVVKIDSGTWKTASVILNDAFFGNRNLRRYDFHIEEDLGVDIIRSIRIWTF